MKKNLKIMALAMLFVVIAGTFSSCMKEYKMQVVYRAGWADYRFNEASDLANACDYLAEKGAMAINGDKIYTVTSNKSKDDCYAQADAMAKADFATSTSKLNVEEAQNLLSAGSFFIYNWTRVDDAGNEVEIGRWECPALPVPEEFGKITIDGVDHTVKSASKWGLTVSGSPATSIFLSTDDDVTFSVVVKNVETTGEVPVGNFEISTDSNVGTIKINGLRYVLTGSIEISLDRKSYKIVSSGIGTSTDARDINFTINCDNVVF